RPARKTGSIRGSVCAAVPPRCNRRVSPHTACGDHVLPAAERHVGCSLGLVAVKHHTRGEGQCGLPDLHPCGGIAHMTDLLTPQAKLNPMPTRSREVYAAGFVQPRAASPSSDGLSWLSEYAAFLHEQEDRYCQAS